MNRNSVIAVAVLALAVGVGMLLRGLRGRNAPAEMSQSSMTFNSPHSKLSVSRGELLFQMHCAKCHGPEGRGDGEGAAKLKPPPRDFAIRPWRFEPTKASIRRVTQDGILGTAMPSARAAVQGADMDALVEHVYELATRFPPALADLSPEEQLLRAAGLFDHDRGQDAPPLEVVDAAGTASSLSDLKGRLVLLNFWGMGCEHCLAKMPQLQQLLDEFRKRGLVVWNICADADDIQEAQGLLERALPGELTWMDDSGLANGRFEVQSLPTVWLIDAQGKVIGKSYGAKEWTRPELRNVLEHWLPHATLKPIGRTGVGPPQRD